MKKYILTESQIRNLVNNVVDEGGVPWNKGQTKYTPEYLEKIKEKYKGKLLNDFKYGEDRMVYSYVYHKLGSDYYKDFTKDMVKIKEKCPDYTKKEIKDISKKCKTKREFQKKYNCVYKAALSLGPFITNTNGEVINTRDFYNSIVSHMDTPNNLSKRLVYAFEFYDENNEPSGVYVGLTFDSEKRKSHHESGINHIGKESSTAVTKFIKEHPTFTYKFIEKTDYVDADKAKELEKYWEKEYLSA
jgi:hypothetical protein